MNHSNQKAADPPPSRNTEPRTYRLTDDDASTLSLLLGFALSTLYGSDDAPEGFFDDALCAVGAFQEQMAQYGAVCVTAFPLEGVTVVVQEVR